MSDPEAMRFDGSTGHRPSTEARRYLYRVLAAVIDCEMRDPDGWFRGGIKNEFDTRRLRHAAKLVAAEMMRKGAAP